MDWDRTLDNIVEKVEHEHAPSHSLVDQENLRSFLPLEGLRQGAIVEAGYMPEEKKNWGRAIMVSVVIVTFSCFAVLMLLVPVIFPIMDALHIDVK